MEIKTPSELDIAYAAGIVDGEGSLQIDMSGSQHGTCKLDIQMKDREIVDWLAVTFNGSVTSHKTDYGLVYCWRLHGTTAATFISLIRNSLKLKTKQATVLLAFAETIREKKISKTSRSLPDAVILYRLKLAEIMTELNRRRTKTVAESTLEGVIS